MIKHMVSWKLASANADARREQTEKIVAGLKSLDGVVPSIRSLHVGATVVDGPHHWDLGLIVEFDDEAGLAAYQANPDHQAVGRYIRSVISEQVTVDFEV
jgi:hypothetical protein